MPTLTSVFPGKVVIGDYTKDSENEASSWIIDDQRGGIGVEEMDEGTDSQRCWWSTADLRYKGHLVLPPLASSISFPDWSSFPAVTQGGFEAWSDTHTPTGWTWSIPASQTTQVIQDGTVKRSGSYSFQFLGNENPGQTATLWQQVANDTKWAGISITATAYGKVTTGTLASARLYIDDGGSKYYASTFDSDSDFTAKTVTRVISTGNIKIGIECTSNNGGNPIWVDDVSVALTSAITTANIRYCNFNSNLYISRGNTLFKLNGSGTGLTVVKAQNSYNITGLVVGPGNNLYIGFGDNNYSYMNTSETITATNSGNATFMCYWDGYLWKMSSAGALFYAATPNSATPSWTAGDSGGAINAVGNVTVKQLQVYRDKDGSPVLYAVTTTGLWSYDDVGTKWVQTELTLPEHPNAGAGFVWWRDSAYISAGLDVLKYVAGSIAQITSLGLSKGDGIPTEHRGEIMAFIKGYNAFYALVDSSQSTGTGTSFVAAYDEHGWQVLWAGASADKTMNGGVVSSVYDYRLWFDHDGTIYYIPLDRSLINPVKVSTSTYAASAVHVTPWFDAAYNVGSKLALRAKMLAKGLSANETIVVKYRTDHAQTDLTTGWTTLTTLAAAQNNVETTVPFGSSAGTLFNAIQFKLELARGSTTTLTPDLVYLAFSYLKLPRTSWGWRVTVDCTHPFNGRTPEQLCEAIEAAAATQTLMAFYYEDTAKYVRIRQLTGTNHTGQYQQGMYTLFLTEP
ncbi:MAG: hypothetical protein TUN42_04235 [Dehalogenimonas sp.]